MMGWYVCDFCLIALIAAGCASIPAESGEVRATSTRGDVQRAAKDDPAAQAKLGAPTFRAAAVRYQVADVERSIAFYTQHLGFKLDQQSGKAFAEISNGSLILYLSGPKSSGSRPFPDGRRQEPGGWNRIVLEVTDLPTRVEALKQTGIRFRYNDVVTGPGGKQIQIEDPDGNPVELFEPAR